MNECMRHLEYMYILRLTTSVPRFLFLDRFERIGKKERSRTYCCFSLKITREFKYYLKMMALRVCPPKHKAVVLQTISPISMKLYQFKGVYPQNSNRKTGFRFGYFRGERDHFPPRFLLVFTKEIVSK